MIKKLKTGKWRARFRWRVTDKNGKSHQYERSKVFVLKSDAEDWLLEQKQEKAQGKNKKATTYVYLFDHYYNTFKVNHVRDNTKAGWQLSRKAFVDYFGGYKLVDKITREEWQQFIDNFANSHRHHTCVSINQRLVEVLNYAVEEGYINRNPASKVKIGGKDAINVEYLNVEQIKKVLKYIATTRFRRRHNLDKPIGTPYSIACAIYTGARSSEIAGLTWDRVDFDKKTITIDRQWNTRSGKGNHGFTKLKTKASERTIPVPDQFLNQIKSIRDDGDEFVFNSEQNHPLQASTMGYTLHHILDECDIDVHGFHFHSLRHSHVALLLNSGVDIYTISQRLGHSRFDITLNTYAYLIDEQKKRNDKKVINALEQLP